jgi:hypothetical protein
LPPFNLFEQSTDLDESRLGKLGRPSFHLHTIMKDAVPTKIISLATEKKLYWLHDDSCQQLTRQDQLARA